MKTTTPPKTELDQDTAERVLKTDLSNILSKAKSGKPLSKHERTLIAKQAHPDGKTGSRQFDSMGACASALNISLGTVKKAKRSGCPAFRHGRVSESALIRWLSEHRQELGANSPLDLDSAKLADMLERIRQRKMSNDKAAGLLVDKLAVQRDAAQAMSLVFEELDRIFKHELPPSVKGLGEVEIQAICAREIERLRATLKERFEHIAD